MLNQQLLWVCKPLVDAIGNIEEWQVSLAHCVLKLLKVARMLHKMKAEDREDASFLEYARQTLNKSFHDIVTDVHFLALFLHPLCWRLAIGTSPYLRTFSDACCIALDLAEQWGWDDVAAAKLVDNLQDYQAAKGVYAGGKSDGQQWWEDLPISGAEEPIKSLALDLFCIMAHVAKIEHLFLDLCNTQGQKGTQMATQMLKIHA